MPYINYVSEAPVTLPRLRCAPSAVSEKPKVCYGDLYRASAPLPKVFVPDDFTLADREQRRQRRKAWEAKVAAANPKPPAVQRSFLWTPEIVARMIELITNYGLCRREAADRLNAEFPQACPVKKNAVVVKFLRETKDANYGR